MERIIYRKTLDVHKNGIQFTLQGFETKDNLSRRFELSLMASGDTVDFPSEKIAALMYITTPNSKEPSIEHCSIRDNVVVYDVLPIVEEGITEMQLKILSTDVHGATSVLMSPRFAVEVTKSNADDESAEQSTTFTALEDAVAKACAVYESRLERIEVDDECTFRVFYADGTVYETDAIRESLLIGNALLSKSWAVGDTGIRENENTDNSKYYCNMSKSLSAEAKEDGDRAAEMLEEVRKHGVYTSFDMDFDSGELQYVSPSYDFVIDEESGELKSIGKDYSFEEVIRGIVAEDIAPEVAQIIENTIINAVNVINEAPIVAPYASDLIAEYSNPTLVRWDSATAHTPYASGLTSITEGFAIVHGKASANHTVVAWATGNENDNYFIHTINGGVIKGWNGYLSKSGGTLSGSVGVGGGKGEFSANEEGAVLEAKDGENTRQIKIANPTAEGIPLSDAVMLSETINGLKTNYKLFGEHNIGQLISGLNFAQIEYGSFQGIGTTALNRGTKPSIEFTNIYPIVVVIFEEYGIHYFVRTLKEGFGRNDFENFTYFQTWEDKKLSWSCHSYSALKGHTTFLPSKDDANYYLADPEKTYTYIGIGISGGDI